MNWLDLTVYKLFWWRWQSLLIKRPDLAVKLRNSLDEHLKSSYSEGQLEQIERFEKTWSKNTPN